MRRLRAAAGHQWRMNPRRGRRLAGNDREELPKLPARASCSKPSATGGGVPARSATSTDRVSAATKAERRARRPAGRGASPSRTSRSRAAARRATPPPAMPIRRPPAAHARHVRSPCPTPCRDGPHGASRTEPSPERRARRRVARDRDRLAGCPTASATRSASSTPTPCSGDGDRRRRRRDRGASCCRAPATRQGARDRRRAARTRGA